MPSQNGIAEGAICEEPLEVGQTVFMGAIMLVDNGTVRNSDDCSTCVRTPASANQVTATPAIARVYNPSIDFEVSPVTVVETASGEMRLDVHVKSSYECLRAVAHFPQKGESVTIDLEWEGQTAYVASAMIPASVGIGRNDVLEFELTPGCALFHADYQPRQEWVVTGTTQVAVDDEAGPGEMAEFRLGAPYPNPTAGKVRFDVTVPRSTDVRIVLVDLLGREVAVLHEGLVAGTTSVSVDTRSLAPGVYGVRAAAGSGAVASHRLRVVR